MNKDIVLAKLREIAQGEDLVNPHLDVDAKIRWWWAWQSAEQMSEMTTKDLAEIYFDSGIKPYTTAEQVAEEVYEFDKENVEAAFKQFREFMKGNV